MSARFRRRTEFDRESPEIPHLYAQDGPCVWYAIKELGLNEPGNSPVPDDRVMPGLDWLAESTDPRLPALSSAHYVVAPVYGNSSAAGRCQILEAFLGQKVE